MKSTHSHAEGREMHAKRSLRASMRHTRAGLELEHARELTRAAAGHLLEVIATRGPSIVGMYATRGRELGTLEVARALRARGVVLAYPRVVANQAALDFHRVDEPWKLEVGNFGVAEPAPSAAVIAVESIELFVVPGLAFDHQGYRLGWGKGYYDATLAQSGGLRVGYGYRFQQVERVPHLAHDVRMDVLVSEAGVVTVGSREPLRPRRGQAGQNDRAGPNEQDGPDAAATRSNE